MKINAWYATYRYCTRYYRHPAVRSSRYLRRVDANGCAAPNDDDDWPAPNYDANDANGDYCWWPMRLGRVDFAATATGRRHPGSDVARWPHWPRRRRPICR